MNSERVFIRVHILRSLMFFLSRRVVAASQRERGDAVFAILDTANSFVENIWTYLPARVRVIVIFNHRRVFDGRLVNLETAN